MREAIDEGIVELRRVEHFGKRAYLQDKPKKTTIYLATLPDGQSWDIGQKLYESRMGKGESS